MGVFQYRKKALLLGAEQAQGFIQGRVAGLLPAQAIEGLGDGDLLGGGGRQAVRLEPIVEPPELLLDAFLRLPLTLGQRNQPRDLPLAMHPAQAVQEAEQFELRRVVANQPQLGVPRFRQQGAEEGRFRNHRPMVCVRDPPPIQLRFPGCSAAPTRIGFRLQPALELDAGAEPFQTLNGLFAPRVTLLGQTQQLQEVQPRFRIGRVEGGKQFIADVRADGVVAAVPRGRVVAVQIAADLPRHRQQRILLGVECFLPVEQDRTDLPRRNVDAQLPQLLQQPSLRDVVLMDLVEHVLTKPNAEMSRDGRRQRRGPKAAVGQQVHRPPVAGVVRLDAKILNDEVPILLDSRS